MIKIILDDYIHPSLNKWTNWHWTKKSEQKKFCEELVYYASKKYHNLLLDDCKITIVYYFDNKHKRDKDNYTPKFIMDGLVKAKVILDDNTTNVFLNWKLDYSKNKRTEIDID